MHTCAAHLAGVFLVLPSKGGNLMSKSLKQTLKDQVKEIARQTGEALEHQVKEGAKATVKAVTGQKLTEGAKEEENLGKKRWQEYMVADLKDKEMSKEELEEKTRRDRWVSQEKARRIKEAIMPKKKQPEEKSIYEQINEQREQEKKAMEEDAKKLEEQRLPLTTKRPRGDWRGIYIKRKQSPELGKVRY